MIRRDGLQGSLGRGLVFLLGVGLSAACSSDGSGAVGEGAGGIPMVGNGGLFGSGGLSSVGSGGLPAGSGGVPGSTGGEHGAIGGTSSVGSGGADVFVGGSGNSSGGASTGGQTGDDAEVDAVELVEQLGFGTNIGNTLENTTSWETGWGQPLITQAFIQGLASRGMKTVRVPVAWDTYAQNGTIDPDKTRRVQEVVRWIVDAGMYAIVNIHWDGGWIDNEKGTPPYSLTPAIKAKFENYWKQIGAAFVDVGHHLILEGMNEEGRWTTDGMAYGPPDIAPLNEMNQLFVTTVRNLGGHNATRALLIAGFNTDIEKTCVAAFRVPTDPAGEGKLFLSLHFYTPFTFTLMDEPADWGSPARTWGTTAEKQQLESLFTLMGRCSAEKKIPIILGEFASDRGVNYPRDTASRIAWLTAVVRASKQHGAVPVLWDTGHEISRTDGAFSSVFQSAFDAY